MNTDDYEGHTPAPWKLRKGETIDEDWPWLDIVDENGHEIQECVGFSDTEPGPDVRLMVDAPLLFAEVERLRVIEEQHRRMGYVLADYHKLPKDHVDYGVSMDSMATDKVAVKRFDLSRLRQVVYDEFLEGDYSFYERLADAYRWKEGDVY